MVSSKPMLYRIADFLQWNKRDELTLSPEFQRRPVWQTSARSYLIDTIIRGLPVPPIYLQEGIIAKNQSVIREVVDGQQRLRAVFDFVGGTLKIRKTHNPALAGKSFVDLSTADQEKFLRYAFSVNLIEQATLSDILDIFARINSYTIPLNRQEKLNAKYFGEFKTIVYKLSRQQVDFWRQNAIVSERQLLRMTEAELVSELLVAMLAGLQDKKKSIESFYRKYDEEFRETVLFEKRFRTILKLIEKIMGQELNKTTFHRRPLFYSLFCVLYDIAYGLPGSKNSTLVLPKKRYLNIRKALKKLSDQVNSSTPDPDYLEFVRACTRQTDNIKPRQIRHEVMRATVQTAVKGD